jgi:uncharacterized protein (TIGR04255 family)
MKPLAEEPPAVRPEPPVFRFLSSDGDTMASLSLGFYALSTTAYTHWPEFLELLFLLNRAAHQVYELPYATRVGLRYINHITFDNTGLRTLSELWNVLRPEFTALLHTECWDTPQGMDSRLSLSGEGTEKLTLRTGYADGEKPRLLLDFDYYSEGHIDLESLPGLCERYHEIILRAFRWCIREDRLIVFDPVSTD